MADIMQLSRQLQAIMQLRVWPLLLCYRADGQARPLILSLHIPDSLPICSINNLFSDKAVKSSATSAA